MTQLLSVTSASSEITMAPIARAWLGRDIVRPVALCVSRWRVRWGFLSSCLRWWIRPGLPASFIVQCQGGIPIVYLFKKQYHISTLDIAMILAIRRSRFVAFLFLRRLFFRCRWINFIFFFGSVEVSDLCNHVDWISAKVAFLLLHNNRVSCIYYARGVRDGSDGTHPHARTSFG